jgi:hypothetical protein
MRQLEYEVEATTDLIEIKGSYDSWGFEEHWSSPRHRNGVQHGVGEGRTVTYEERETTEVMTSLRKLQWVTCCGNFDRFTLKMKGKKEEKERVFPEVLKGNSHMQISSCDYIYYTRNITGRNIDRYSSLCSLFFQCKTCLLRRRKKEEIRCVWGYIAGNDFCI